MTAGEQLGGPPPRVGHARGSLISIVRVLVLSLLLAGSASAQQAARQARLGFTKVLKGSSPEYMSLTVDADGTATYDGRSMADPPSPHNLQISPSTTAHLFSLAESLGYFRGLQLESRHKVADLGKKTLTYESQGESNRVEFNYTENRTAQQLAEEFEKISNVEQHISQLEYAIKYDPLGLPEQLRQIQIELNQHALIETDLLSPTLQKITSNSHFLHLAQARAQDILGRIREQN